MYKKYYNKQDRHHYRSSSWAWDEASCKQKETYTTGIIQYRNSISNYLYFKQNKSLKKCKIMSVSAFLRYDRSVCIPLLVLVEDGVELLEGHEEVVRGLVDQVGVPGRVQGVAEARAHRVVDVQHAGVAVPKRERKKICGFSDTKILRLKPST